MINSFLKNIKNQINYFKLLFSNFLEFWNIKKLNYYLKYNYFLIKSFKEFNLKNKSISYDISTKKYDFILKLNLIIKILFKLINFASLNNQPYFHHLLDFIIVSYFNIFFPWILSDISSKFFIEQIQKLRNKKMQKIGILTIYLFNFKLLMLKLNYEFLNNLNYFSVIGIYFIIKGRAVNMRRVQVRYNYFGPIFTKKFINFKGIYLNSSKSIFTTKWGSTSFKTTYFYKNIIV